MQEAAMLRLGSAVAEIAESRGLTEVDLRRICGELGGNMDGEKGIAGVAEAIERSGQRTQRRILHRLDKELGLTREERQRLAVAFVFG
jgi:hypothetical protein